MTSPLDEKGMAAARMAYKNADYPGKSLSDAIRAYLSAVALPDALEVVARLRYEAGLVRAERNGFKEVTPRSRTMDEAADALSQAHSTIAVLRAKLDEALLCQQEIAAGTDRSATVARIIIAKNEAEGRAETAEAEVKRLTEEKDDILGDFSTTAFELQTAEARIKALEEALRELADQADHCVLGVACKRNVEDAIQRLAECSNRARTVLNSREKADGARKAMESGE